MALCCLRAPLISGTHLIFVCCRARLPACSSIQYPIGRLSRLNIVGRVESTSLKLTHSFSPPPCRTFVPGTNQNRGGEQVNCRGGEQKVKNVFKPRRGGEERHARVTQSSPSPSSQSEPGPSTTSTYHKSLCTLRTDLSQQLPPPPPVKPRILRYSSTPTRIYSYKASIYVLMQDLHSHHFSVPTVSLCQC